MLTMPSRPHSWCCSTVSRRSATPEDSQRGCMGSLTRCAREYVEQRNGEQPANRLSPRVSEMVLLCRIPPGTGPCPLFMRKSAHFPEIPCTFAVRAVLPRRQGRDGSGGATWVETRHLLWSPHPRKGCPPGQAQRPRAHYRSGGPSSD